MTYFKESIIFPFDEKIFKESIKNSIKNEDDFNSKVEKERRRVEKFNEKLAKEKNIKFQSFIDNEWEDKNLWKRSSNKKEWKIVDFLVMQNPLLIKFDRQTKKDEYEKNYSAENKFKKGFLLPSLLGSYQGDIELIQRILISDYESIEQIKYKSYFDHLAIQQFNTRIETAIFPVKLDFSGHTASQTKEGEKEDDRFDIKLRQILALQSQYIKNLMLQKRGIGDKPEEIILKHPTTKQPRTNAELIGFKSTNGFTGQKRNRLSEEPINVEYLEDAFEELDKYCQDIVYDYKVIKKFITEDYNNYFNQQEGIAPTAE